MLLFLSPFILFLMSTDVSGEKDRKFVRADGVIMGYDPYAPDIMEKYGKPGKTDNEGFDPYKDRVGPGIYGGIVQRDEAGEQYQNHNPRPGPVYAGGGYTPMSNALRVGELALKPLLDKYPELVNDISTGGATPLHMCGMGRDNEQSTAFLITRGAGIELVDTYGYRPLHRMASNNLAFGAEALLSAGADPRAPKRSHSRETPMSIARASGAGNAIKVLQRYLK
jgi:ankyrin repeat protein